MILVKLNEEYIMFILSTSIISININIIFITITIIGLLWNLISEIQMQEDFIFEVEKINLSCNLWNLRLKLQEIDDVLKKPLWWIFINFCKYLCKKSLSTREKCFRLKHFAKKTTKKLRTILLWNCRAIMIVFSFYLWFIFSQCHYVQDFYSFTSL